MNEIILFLAIALLIFSIWNTLSLRKRLKNPPAGATVGDDRYFELKNRLEFITTIYIVVTLIGGYVGFNIETKLKTTQTELLSFEEKIKADSILLSKYQAIFSQLDSGTNILGSKIDTRIRQLEGKDIIQQKTYIVSNVKYKLIDSDHLWQRYSFSDFTTITGQKLPNFTSPPFILAISNEGANVTVANVSTKGFELEIGSYDGRHPGNNFIVTLFISESR